MLKLLVRLPSVAFQATRTCANIHKDLNVVKLMGTVRRADHVLNTKGEYCVFLLSCVNSWRSREGNYKKIYMTHTVSVFDPLAVKQASGVAVGDRIFVQGRLNYTTPKSFVVRKLMVVADTVIPLQPVFKREEEHEGQHVAELGEEHEHEDKLENEEEYEHKLENEEQHHEDKHVDEQEDQTGERLNELNEKI